MKIYRAANRAPGEIKRKGGFYGFRSMSLTAAKTHLKKFLETPDKIEEQTRSGKGIYISCATEPGCLGYAGKMAYTYEFSIPSLSIREYDIVPDRIAPTPFALKNKKNWASLYTDKPTWANVSFIALGHPRTAEIVFIVGIPWARFTRYHAKGEKKWHPASGVKKKTLW